MPRGGPRPGAGAPKGNLNDLKHGHTSRQLKQASRILAALPRRPEPPDDINPRMSKRRRATAMLATHLLVSILERVPSRLESRSGPAIRKVRELLEAASDSRKSGKPYARFPPPFTRNERIQNP